MKDNIPCFRIKPGFGQAFEAHLKASYELWTATLGTDGISRLQPVAALPETTPGALPVISFKKLLTPPKESLWTWDGIRFTPAEPQPRRAVFGVARCDLQALWYLDQVFADDALYQKNRQQLLVIGAPCQATDGCRCQPSAFPLSGDLFLADDHVWSLSSSGNILLTQLTEWLGVTVNRPLPEPRSATTESGDVSEALFKSSLGAPLWQQASQPCLACGACSVVCPTCYCYDMIDHNDLTGTCTRQRVWDNCFFSSHAKVAGGHDFRPDRAARLRFRFEHKKLGFGTLRGRPSCVGCGRCLEACPVGIDLDQVARQLQMGHAL